MVLIYWHQLFQFRSETIKIYLRVFISSRALLLSVFWVVLVENRKQSDIILKVAEDHCVSDSAERRACLPPSARENVDINIFVVSVLG